MTEYGVWDSRVAAFVGGGYSSRRAAEAAREVLVVDEADSRVAAEALFVRPECPDHPGESGEPDACQYGHEVCRAT